MLAALGDTHRQAMLLMFDRGEKLSIAQICAALPLSRTAVTYHLRVLARAGVLTSERAGKEVQYRIDKRTTRGALTAVVNYIDTQL